MRFLTAVAALFLASCSSMTTKVQAQLINNVVTGCVRDGDFDVETDYFPEKYIPPTIFTYDSDVNLYGETFVPNNTTDLLEISYHKTYKIVTNKHQNVSYLLYQCGTEPPQDEIDSGRHHLVLPIPHTGGIAITQTPHITPMELLGRREDIIGYIGDPSLVSSPCMQHMMAGNDATIETVWDETDPYNSTTQASLRADFLERHPNAIILGGPTDEAPFGDRVMNVAASQERTNVATFDWIAMYAALFNLEALSNQISRETQARYDCTSTNARMIVDQKTSRERRRRELASAADTVNTVAEEQPRQLQEEQTNHTDLSSKSASDIKILWATYFTGYNWSVADCSTWDNAYYCEYATHCGTNIISRPPDLGYFTTFGGPTKYYYVNDDELLQIGKDADIWIFPSNRWDSVYEEKSKVMDQIKAVQHQQVYDNQGSGSNAWFEQRLAEYDVVGLDMCDLVGTANPNGPPHQRRWFRNIFTEDIGELEACRIPEELTEPYVPQGAECELLTEADFQMESEITQPKPEAPVETPAEDTDGNQELEAETTGDEDETDDRSPVQRATTSTIAQMLSS